jgi:hypothetical protein
MTSIFNIMQNVWTPGPQLLKYRAEHACGLIKDRNSLTTVILVGGYDNYLSVCISTTEYLDINTNKWVSGPGLPFPICGPVIVPNPAGGILLVGGSSSTTILSLSSVASTWTSISRSLKVGRFLHVALPSPYSNVTSCTCKKNKVF